MSHFIERTSKLQSSPLLKTINKHIAEPSLSLLQSSENLLLQNSAEKKMVKLMFFQFKNAEYEKLHRENSVHMQKQFEDLRRKLALRARREYFLFQIRTVQQKMEVKEQVRKVHLGDIMKSHPEQVDLIKKYRGKIRQKLEIYRQSQSIVKAKDTYNSWLDKTNNSPLKSPSYSKMTYMLEKINRDESPAKENRGHQRKSYKSNNEVIVQMPRLREARYTTPKASQTEFSLYF